MIKMLVCHDLFSGVNEKSCQTGIIKENEMSKQLFRNINFNSVNKRYH